MFCHLHTHDQYSLLDGCGTAAQFAHKASELDQEALAITNHGSLSGSLEHIEACSKAGIKPIVGVEAYFKPNRLRHEKDNADRWHLTLLAKNEQGWKSLMRIVSESYSTGFYYKPCVDFDLLRSNRDGLIVMSACINGFIANMIERGDDEIGETFVKWALEIFKDDFFIEIMPHDFDRQKQLNVELVNLAERHSVPLVATVDAHYPYQEWADTQDVVLMMNSGQSLKSREKKKEQGDDVYEFGTKSLYLMTEEEVRIGFARYHPDLPSNLVDNSIYNSVYISSLVEPFAVSKSPKFPKIEGGREEASRIIKEWCGDGLKRIGKSNSERYQARLRTELQVLQQYAEYFVIVGDAVRWARSQGIRIGPGRGSAAGSLVSYLIGITSIDPIQYGLLFERFINPDRKDWPDIDIDVQHDRRQEVKDYFVQRWGQDKVADVITHQTFGPRSALQDVARVLDIPYDEVMKVTATIDPTDTSPLAELLPNNKSLQSFIEKYPQIWEHAQRVQGQIKSGSKHPAAIVITDKSIYEYMPTMRAKDDSTVTAWSDRPEFPIISIYGFLKIDVLSTDGLTKQQFALDLI